MASVFSMLPDTTIRFLFERKLLLKAPLKSQENLNIAKLFSLAKIELFALVLHANFMRPNFTPANAIKKQMKAVRICYFPKLVLTSERIAKEKRKKKARLSILPTKSFLSIFKLLEDRKRTKEFERQKNSEMKGMNEWEKTLTRVGMLKAVCKETLFFNIKIINKFSAQEFVQTLR